MNKLTLAGVLVAVAAGAFVSGSLVSRSTSQSNSDGQKVLYYVDPMNPSHTSDKPGLAPCGMKMEPVYAQGGGSGGAVAKASEIPGTVHLSAEKKQMLGVAVAPVEQKPSSHSLRLLGRVAVDETRIYKINATVNGWVTETSAAAVGSRVKKHEVLACVYSPEFLAAAQALLYSLNAQDRDHVIVERQSDEQKAGDTESRGKREEQYGISQQQYADALKNLGMGDMQIREIVKTRKFAQKVDVASPADGFILTRNITDGQRFEKGTEMFRIADLAHVWILADVPSSYSEFIEPGAIVEVSVPDVKKKYVAAVSEALPQFDITSRTLKLRLEADNPAFELKPDMFVDLEMPVELAETIVVPADAVLDGGKTKTLFVEREPGVFEPRQVETGWRHGDQVQILAGLQPAERIAVSGTFLLDSESRMKLAAGTQTHCENVKDPVCGMSVDPAEVGEKQRFEYRGQKFLFCNEGCKRRFEAAPETFLAKAEANPAVTSLRGESGVLGTKRPISAHAAQQEDYQALQGRRKAAMKLQSAERQSVVPADLPEAAEIEIGAPETSTEQVALPSRPRVTMSATLAARARRVAAMMTNSPALASGTNSGHSSQAMPPVSASSSPQSGQSARLTRASIMRAADANRQARAVAMAGGAATATESKDPVCGMTVEKRAEHKLQHGGMEYYFCSAGCLEQFKKEPTKFVVAAGAKSTATFEN